MESAAGAWVETAKLAGNGIRPGPICLAPAEAGGWWLLHAHATEGIRLERLGGLGNDSFEIPRFQSTPWDSTTASLGSDLELRPIIVARARGQGLVRAALADTGWALSLVAQTSSGSLAWDIVIDTQGYEHLAYHRLLSQSGQYQRVEPRFDP
jgi:hypothetical protein